MSFHEPVVMVIAKLRLTGRTSRRCNGCAIVIRAMIRFDIDCPHGLTVADRRCKNTAPEAMTRTVRVAPSAGEIHLVAGELSVHK